MKNSKSGYVLLTTILVMFFIATLGSVLFRYADLRSQQLLRDEEYDKAFWSVEAALTQVQSRLYHGLSLESAILFGNRNRPRTKINDYECKFNILENEFVEDTSDKDKDDDKDKKAPTLPSSEKTLYCTTKTKNGRTVQVSLECVSAPISRYAWGSYNAGSWPTWGRDTVGGLSGVNRESGSINWGGDTIAGPFFTYDILTADGNWEKQLKLGAIEAIDFVATGIQGGGLHSLRKDKYDKLLAMEANNESENTLLWHADAKKNGNFDKKFPSGTTLLPMDEAIDVLESRSQQIYTTIDDKWYDHVVDETPMHRARVNYYDLLNSNHDEWVEDIGRLKSETFSSSNPFNKHYSSASNDVYRLVVDGDNYKVTKGKVYFEASITKGIIEQRRARESDSVELLGSRYYLDRKNDFTNVLVNVDSTNAAVAIYNAVNLDQDLPVFLDVKFDKTTEQHVKSGTISKDPLLIFPGDLFMSGELDGKLTVVAGDNIYIEKEEFVYKNVPNRCWNEWDVPEKYWSGTKASGTKLSDKLKNDFLGTNAALQKWIYADKNTFSDMATVYAGRQVIPLSDELEEDAELNCHGSYLMVHDVDYEFGKGWDIRLEEGLDEQIKKTFQHVPEEIIASVFPEGRHSDFYAKYVKRVTGKGGSRRSYWVWEWHVDPSSADAKTFDSLYDVFSYNENDKYKLLAQNKYKIVTSDFRPGGTYTINNIGDVLTSLNWRLDLIRRRPVRADGATKVARNDYTDSKGNYEDNSFSGKDYGITTSFYKDYCTTGMAPWDKHVKKRSQGYVFGGLLQYRHARWIPGGGYSRRFIYDWRLGRERTEGVADDKYIFGEWRQLKGKDIVTF